MKAYALVQGSRRKVLYVSDSCAMLWTLGAETFKPSGSVNFQRNERAICKANDAYVVRIDFTLGDPITKPRKPKTLKPATVIRPVALYCHAARDGDCNWAQCPQVCDGEAVKSGRNCPLDVEDEDS